MDCAQPDSCRESKVEAQREGTSVCTAVYTIIKDYVVYDRTGCLMKEHLVRERPKPAEPSVIPSLYLNNTTKRPAPMKCTVQDLKWQS